MELWMKKKKKKKNTIPSTVFNFPDCGTVQPILILSLK